MAELPKNYLEIRGTIVHCHALIDDDGGVVLLDGGFLGNAVGRIDQALQGVERSLADVKAIVLTHGHIDHTLNIARLKSLTGATVYAPDGEQAHINGTHTYHGASRVCGVIEAIGRTMLDYHPPEVDHWFKDGEVLDFWGGLEVIKLPGHTLNHSGFYSRSKKVLFGADLFANFTGKAKAPPRWFNVDSDLDHQSILRASKLDLSGGVVLSHGYPHGPQRHRADLQALAEQLGG